MSAPWNRAPGSVSRAPTLHHSRTPCEPHFGNKCADRITFFWEFVGRSGVLPRGAPSNTERQSRSSSSTISRSSSSRIFFLFFCWFLEFLFINFKYFYWPNHTFSILEWVQYDVMFEQESSDWFSLYLPLLICANRLMNVFASTRFKRYFLWSLFYSNQSKILGINMFSTYMISSINTTDVRFTSYVHKIQKKKQFKR